MKLQIAITIIVYLAYVALCVALMLRVGFITGALIIMLIATAILFNVVTDYWTGRR